MNMTQMAKDCTWATEIEIYTMAYLLRTLLFLFKDHCRCGVNPRRCTCNPTAWTRISWAGVLRIARPHVPHINDSAALYLYHPINHFELVKARVHKERRVSNCPMLPVTCLRRVF